MPSHAARPCSCSSLGILDAGPDFRQFLVELIEGPDLPLGDETAPPWFEAGVTCEIDVETYFQFQELLPPRWTEGNLFAIGDGTGLLRLFWRRDGTYFGRELTVAEAGTFCRLGGLPRHG